MTILALIGSYRKNGNTSQLVAMVRDTLVPDDRIRTRNATLIPNEPPFPPC
jgi:NAD(P)H-dependent FMN reductase